MSSVVVTLPVGEQVFMDSTADEFDSGVLTITHDTGAVLATMPPDEWCSATVYGTGLYPEFDITNNVAWRSHVASRALRERSA